MNALSLDLSQEYKRAIKEYEFEIEQGKAEVDSYINLSFLYWRSAAHFVWADEFNIPSDIRKNAVDRYIALLNEAKLKFSDYGELFFWEKYFWHRLVFDPLNEEDVLQILGKYQFESNYVPYFFLSMFNNRKYEIQTGKLLVDCLALPTAKNLYIIELIDMA
jgi:hypothetical protein